MHAIRIPFWLSILTVLIVACPTVLGQNMNRLTPKQKENGWILLFDGKTTEGWKGFKKAGFPEKGWVVEDGCLTHQEGGGGGDIITERTFNNYVFTFEFKLAAKANSGVKYFITEERGAAIGHEYQTMDHEIPADGRPGSKHHTASLYDVLPTTQAISLKPLGEFNRGKIVVRDMQVEHWLNGEKVLEYQLESEALMAAVAKSKFRDVQGFGTKFPHHILLQDHGDRIWFRNLKLRELK